MTRFPREQQPALGTHPHTDYAYPFELGRGGALVAIVVAIALTLRIARTLNTQTEPGRAGVSCGSAAKSRSIVSMAS